MNKKPKFNRDLSISVLLHVVILTALVSSFEFNQPVPVLENSANAKVIQATIIDLSPAPVPAPAPKKIVQPAPPPVPVPPPEPVVTKPKTIAISDLKKQKQLAEKQLLAEMEKEVRPLPKIKHKDIQKDFEKELKNLKQQALKEQAEKTLQQQLLQETTRLQNMQSQLSRGEVDKYKALILHAISRSWLVPSNVNKKLYCQLLIRVAPGGVVLSVDVAKSSGDLALDRSARVAVFKASPLPVPTNVNEFETFRQFILKVKPENILRADEGLV